MARMDPLSDPVDDRQNWDRCDVPEALRRRMRRAARDLRQRETPSERVLWEALRNRGLEGRKFRRQVAIGPFVVDFLCASERLIVEVDGPVHAEQEAADTERQELMEALGFRFVRLSAGQVENDLERALDLIKHAFK